MIEGPKKEENPIRSQCRNVMMESAKVISKAALLYKLLQNTQAQLQSHIQRCEGIAKQIMFRTDFYSKHYFDSTLTDFCKEALKANVTFESAFSRIQEILTQAAKESVSLD